MKSQLKAEVVTATGNTTHSVGNLVDGEPVVTEQIPVAAWVEIAEENGSYFLLHYNAEGICIADTWHANVQEAKEQAEFEFGISESDWRLT